MALQLRRGTDAQRATTIFDQGELVYTTDTKKVYVGDGSTTGGITVGDFDISSVIEDTSPQLGGALDLNSFNITGTGNISITGNITLPSANTINAATVQGVGTSGNITLASIDGSSVSGNVIIQGVNTAIAGQEGGDINIYAGHGLTTGSGGDITLLGGDAGASASGGAVNIIGGNSTGGGTRGGDVTLTGGYGPILGNVNLGIVNTDNINIGATGVTTNLYGTITATRIDGDLQGSVFADDSTCMLDSTFPGGYLTAEQASITGNLYLCEPYSNTPVKKAWQIVENTDTNFFQTIVNASTLPTTTGPHLALQVYRSSPSAGDAGGQLRFFQSAGNPGNPIQALVSIDSYADTIGIANARGELRFNLWDQLAFTSVQILRTTGVVFNKGITINGGGITCNGAGSFALGVTADLKGSVVADNSTMLVDGVGGKIVGPVDSPSVMTPLLDTNDSSAITIVPEVIMSSDATVQNNLTVTNSLTAQQASSTIYTLTPTTEPMNPTVGMIAASNGTTWDPALDGLEHLNVYLNGAWAQLA